MLWYKKAFIEMAIDKNALRFGEFQLKSGRLSPYFFNTSVFADGHSIAQIGQFYAAALEASHLSYDALFGPAYKGIPLVTATAYALAQQYQKNLPYSFNRKEIKTHGEGGSIVGSELKGDIIIIDDVVTAGTAVREAIDIIHSYSAKVVGLVVALDRQEKGPDHLSALQTLEQQVNIKTISLITLEDILNYLPQNHISREAILNYRQMYGI